MDNFDAREILSRLGSQTIKSKGQTVEFAQSKPLLLLSYLYPQLMWHTFSLIDGGLEEWYCYCCEGHRIYACKNASVLICNVSLWTCSCEEFLIESFRKDQEKRQPVCSHLMALYLSQELKVDWAAVNIVTETLSCKRYSQVLADLYQGGGQKEVVMPEC